MAGSDVLIECQASGDPHPDIVWSRKEGDINIAKTKVIHGKGLRIENVHPSDEGTYVCSAKNLVGSVTSEAWLEILEVPEITAQPPNSLQVKKGTERVRLDCLVAGDPKPLVFWTKEDTAASNGHFENGRPDKLLNEVNQQNVMMHIKVLGFLVSLRHIKKYECAIWS